MKTAISIPDDVFRKAEALAQRRQVSRSALYAEALRKYLATQTDDQVTVALDAVYDINSAKLEPGDARLQAVSLPKEAW